MAFLNIKIEDELKSKVDRLADSIGISTTQLVNLKLREFVNEWTINIDLYKNKKSTPYNWINIKSTFDTKKVLA